MESSLKIIDSALNSLEISAEYAWKIKEQLRTEQYERDLMNLRENYIKPTKFINLVTSDDRML
jgi:hypothetical protein